MLYVTEKPTCGSPVTLPGKVEKRDWRLGFATVFECGGCG